MHECGRSAVLYEGVFAHEYQHLLEYYENDAELSWVNEVSPIGRRR